MDLSRIKMVVTDMDGTLLNSYHEVSPLFFKLFKKMKEKNIMFVAASGRQYSSIADKLGPIKNNIIIIAENGAFAMKSDTELFSAPLPNATKNKLLGILEKVPNIHPVLCGKNNAYLLADSDRFLKKLNEYYTRYEILDDLKKFEGEILKIAIYHSESSEKYIYPSLSYLETSLNVKISGQNWLDISSANANKGYALQRLMDSYNLRPDEIMVFGDYNNDLEMLALSDYSFAMANAHPNVKKTAKYSTKSNDDFGVETILAQLF